MTECAAFSAQGPVNITDALRNVDCLSGQAVETAFSRLFGSSGALSQALTLVLTLYVALLALSLLTGRSGIRLNMLTPRMLQLGLVLTFATSWVAYQNVGWNLLVGAPDQVASILLGTKGSATQLFAQRLDMLFDVIARSAHLSASANATAATVGVVPQIAGSSPKPADLLWAASLLLLLGTVGVLIVARIALAAVMALGPIFIIFALFGGTRGLFEGWLKAAVMLALTPMLAVLLGGGTLVLIAPMFNALAQAGGKVSLELASSIFLAAFVYAALMVLAMRATAMITGGWTLGKAERPSDVTATEQNLQQQSSQIIPMLAQSEAAGNASDRIRGVVNSAVETSTAVNQVAEAARSDRRASVISQGAMLAEADVAPANQDPRIRPLGQGFRAPKRLAA